MFSKPKIFGEKVRRVFIRPFAVEYHAENILSLTPTSNSLMQKYIHFIQSTFTRVETQPFASSINNILLCIRDNKISIRQDISLA